MLPIYTRFLSPADYGVIGLLAFALSFVEPILGARLGMALPKFYFATLERRDRRAVIWAAIILTGIASAISVGAVVLFRGAGSQLLFGNREYALALGIFSVTLLSRPLEDTGMMYLRMHERSRLFLAISMIKLLLQVGLNLLLVVYLEKGVIGAVLSGVIASVAIGAVLSVYVATREAPAFDLRITLKMLRFSWPLWVSGLAGLYVGSSGGVYLRVFGSLGDVGRLELALRLATVVGMLIWIPFSQQWVPLSYRYYNEPNGKQKFQAAFIAISALMFIGGLGTSIFARPVIMLMAAKPFYAAVSAVPILTFGFILNELRSFFNFSFLVTDNTKISSIFQYVMAAVITIAYFALVPKYGLLGAAEAQFLAFLVGFIVSRLISRRYYDPELKVALVGTFSLICIAAYVCSNAFGPTDYIVVDLAVRSLAFLAASGAIAVIGIRSINAVNVLAMDSLPGPLGGLVRLASGRGFAR